MRSASSSSGAVTPSRTETSTDLTVEMSFGSFLSWEGEAGVGGRGWGRGRANGARLGRGAGREGARGCCCCWTSRIRSNRQPPCRTYGLSHVRSIESSGWYSTVCHEGSYTHLVRAEREARARVSALAGPDGEHRGGRSGGRALDDALVTLGVGGEALKLLGCERDPVVDGERGLRGGAQHKPGAGSGRGRMAVKVGWTWPHLSQVRLEGARCNRGRWAGALGAPRLRCWLVALSPPLGL